MRAISTLAGRVLRWLPASLVSRILPRSTRYHLTEVPPPPIPPSTPIRLYVGPVNWAGQGWQWSRAVERNVDGVGAVSMSYRLGSEFGHPVDQSVPVGAYVTNRRWQDGQREAVERGFSHVLIEAVRNPFGRIDEPLGVQVAQLKAHGVAVAAMCHGTELRLPSAHALREIDSPFRAGLWPDTPKLEREARLNRVVLDDLGVPVFVSTPDLLIDFPGAIWVPVVVTPDDWRTDSVPLERVVPVVAHAPSRGILKGSDLVDPLLTRLHDEGVVEYLRVERVAASEMPAVFRKADIVLDQFRLGDYGVAACEALAAGRVVVAHVSQHSRDHVSAVTGAALPIVESTAGELEGTLRGILDDRDSARRTAALGVAFAREAHDGRLSAAALRPFLSGASPSA